MTSGIFGAFRRSELIAIQVEHINWKPEAIAIQISKSKTDQIHEGQYCAIAYGNDELCPVRALKEWLDATNIQAGVIFRRILIGHKITETAITPLSVNHILKKCAK